MVILDEADEMLDMGFREDIEMILDKTPEDRQTTFFSATMPKGILDLTKKFQKDPEHVKIVRKELTVPNIKQYYIETKSANKLEVLCRLIDVYNPKLSVVFCNTKRGADELVSDLQARGYFADALHGDLKQTQRDIVMDKFRNGTIDILVATDVAARGIDVDDVEAVFNYDLPQDEEYYVHRIGRTGRAGRTGVSFSFVFGKEKRKMKDIERYTKSKLEKHSIPSISDVEEKKVSVFFEQVKSTIQEGRKQKVQARDIVGAIAGEVGIPGKLVGTIDIYDKYTFVEVPKKHTRKVLDKMKNIKIKGNKVNIERANSKRKK